MTDALAINRDASCWNFLGYIRLNGYGQLYAQGRIQLAHRYVWTVMRGPIPSEKEIDHLCRNRACVNPQHMELVDTRTNLLRGNGASALHARKEACPKCGNAYDYRHPNGSRRCRTCQADMRRDRARRRREGLPIRAWRRGRGQ